MIFLKVNLFKRPQTIFHAAKLTSKPVKSDRSDKNNKKIILETIVTKKVSIVLRPFKKSTGMKERIQQKAAELFRRYGIRSVTMDEIATQLGISKKTIYQFYSDKDTLVKDIFTGITDENKKKCYHFKDISENAIHEQFLAGDSAHEIFNDLEFFCVI
jgi:hypothetical protein